MTQTTIIIYSISIATMFATISGIPQWFAWWLCKKKIWYKKNPSTTFSSSYPNFQRLPRRIKPFDCAECLSFWITLGLTEHAHFAHIDCLGIASVSTTCTFIINSILNVFKK